jgi:hypothetical protein
LLIFPTTPTTYTSDFDMSSLPPDGIYKIQNVGAAGDNKFLSAAPNVNGAITLAPDGNDLHIRVWADPIGIVSNSYDVLIVDL